MSIETKKCAFIGYPINKIGIFSDLLSTKLGVEIEIEDYGNRKKINVPMEKYQESLIVGQQIALENGFRIDWVNAYGEPRPIHYIGTMYCSLPKTREGCSLWEALKLENHCPIDIKEYIEKLKQFMSGRDIKIKYNGSDNAIEFLINGSFEEYELLKQQCDRFNYTNTKTPFIKTIFLEKDGTLIKNVKDDKSDESNLKTYFNESMFLDGLFRPEGSNIAPKTDTEQDLTTGYKYSHSRYGIRNFDVVKTWVYNQLESINGTFVVYEEKDYDHHWNDEKKRQTNCTEIMRFTMLDNGIFKSDIRIIDGQNVSIKTNIDIVRNIVGCNFDGKSVRDGLLTEIPHEDCRKNLEINEYYQVIANRTRLLHYSNSSNFFEVYEIPKGWVVEDGISKLDSPKVFDDIDYDEQDKDLEEINTILASNTNIKGISFVKKNNSNN